MRHRIFIAINLPEDIKKKLIGYKEKWPELPAKWTKKDNLHITLAFLGYLDDEEILEVCKITKEVAKRNGEFVVGLKKISYGPTDKIPPRPPKFSEEKFWRPRMVWIIGEKSPGFTALRDDLENSILNSGKVRFSSEKRKFSPHITLARINQWEWRRIEPEERPEIEENINFSFSVSSIEIMESKLKRAEPEYTILESVPLSLDKNN